MMSEITKEELQKQLARTLEENTQLRFVGQDWTRIADKIIAALGRQWPADGAFMDIVIEEIQKRDNHIKELEEEIAQLKKPSIGLATIKLPKSGGRSEFGSNDPGF